MDPALLNALLDSIREAILSIDHTGKVVFGNKSAFSLFETSQPSLIGRKFSELIDQESRKEFKKIMKLVSARETEELQFYVHKLHEGDEIVPLKVIIKADQNLQGHYALVIEPQHKDNEAYKLYRILAENAYDINVMFEGDHLVYVSPSVQDFLGYKVDEIKTLHDWHKTLHVSDRKTYLEKLHGDESKRESFSFYTYRQKHKNGLYHWFETKIRREFREDGSIVSIATSVDITQRKKAEIELEKQREFIEELFDTDPNIIYVRDGNGRMIYCNKAVADLVGVSRDEFLMSEENVFPTNADNFQKYMKMESKVINLGQEVLMEEQIADKNGNVNYYQTIKKALHTRDGDVNVLNISTNINKIKYYERESQKLMQAKSEFFSSMSHEIRTPMNAINGMTDLLLRRNPRKDQVKLLQTLNYSAKNLLSLINNILDFSKIEAGKVEVEEINFNLKELLDSVRMSFRPKVMDKGLKIKLEVEKGVPEIVKGDSIKLGQLLNNLVGNAIKFTQEGSVTILVKQRESKGDLVDLEFHVKDTGIGIPEEKLDSIFDPFNQASISTTRKYGGTGLGLSIVKNLVEIQHGTIKVTSEENVGSDFMMTIPFRKADEAQPVSALSDSKISDVKWRMDLNILYVEDVKTNQFLIEEILSEWGIKVEMASDGKTALEKIKRRDFDMVLMDVQMPDMDGYETTRRIRDMGHEYFRQVPIIALTASTSEGTRHKIYKSGMQDIVLKPIIADELLTKILEYANIVEDMPTMGMALSVEEDKAKDPNINFEKTDDLFLGNLVRYQEFLKMTIQEFGLNRDSLIDCIRGGDLETFRQVRHRMRSILSTFGMEELDEYMEEIKQKMPGGKMPERQKEDLIKGLKIHIEFLIDALNNKMASLKWL